MLLESRLKGLREHAVSLVEYLLHRPALLAVQGTEDIVLAVYRAALEGYRVIDRDGWSSFLIVDLRVVKKVLQDIPVRPDKEAYRLSDVPHVAIREASPVLLDHPELVPAILRYILC